MAQLVLVVPWVALVIDAWMPIRDNSFLWHIRAGSVQAAQGRVLTSDPFSFTVTGESWLTQSWLVELLYAWGEDLSGLGFVPPMMLITSVLTFVGIGLIVYRHSHSVTATAVALVLSTLLMISFLVPRPVLFSYLLFVLVILAVERPATRWVLPFLFWVWASTHGSFLIGLGYVGLRLLMGRNWKALPTAIAAGLATLLTAHGLGVLQILVDFGRARDTLSLLSEWRTPTLESPVFLVFVGGLVIIGLGAARRKITLEHLWLLVPFAALGFTSLRAVPPAWLGILPLVAVALQGTLVGSKPRFSVVPASVFGVVVLVLPFLLVESPEIDEERFPVEAVDHLADVRTFHDDRVGGYLIWAEWPERQVYLDDRAELYLDRMAEFVDVRSGDEDWRPVFERDGIEQALLRNEDAVLEDLIGAGWTTVFEGERYTVLRS